MMITLRKLPLAIAVTAGILSAHAGAVDFKGYARSGIGWTGSGGEQQCFQQPVHKVNTVSVTNVKPTPN